MNTISFEFNLLFFLGGLLYFSNKLFLTFKAFSRTESKEKVYYKLATLVYPFGLVPWLIFFLQKPDWIAFALEAGGFFSMLLGIRKAFQGEDERTKSLEKKALFITKIFISFGIFASIYQYGFFKELSQIFEILMVVGFLLGTFEMARNSTRVYLWFMLMNFSCAFLVLEKGEGILLLFQLVSLSCMFVSYLKIKDQ